MKIQFNSKEILILLAASTMSFIANLPDTMLGGLIDRKVLLGALASLVVVAMFRYLQAMLLLTISILAVGANLPAELAESLEISQTALLVALGGLIGIALLNRMFKVLPTNAESAAEEVARMREMLMAAIAKGDVAMLGELLAGGMNVNFVLEGKTPLHLAAEKGYPEVVKMLVSGGADIQTRNAEGLTALEIALAKKKFVQTTAILLNAGGAAAYSTYGATPDKTESRRGGDADLWREQRSD